MDWIRNNPGWAMGMIESLIAAVLNLILVYGVTVSTEQAAAINAVVLIVAALILSLWAQKPISALVDKAAADGFAKGLTAKHD